MSPMKIYFCGQIGGPNSPRKDTDLYGRLIHKLQQYGEVLTPHVGNPELLEQDFKDCGQKGTKYIHDRDVVWLKEADVVIAEVTQVSMGVGYEIGRATEMNKPIMCLFRPKDGELSVMISGAHNGSSFLVVHYAIEDQLDPVFHEFLMNVQKSS